MKSSRENTRDDYLQTFNEYNFERTKKVNKSDEYKNVSRGVTLYFFWNQGLESELDIAISPYFDHTPLLRLTGVRLKSSSEASIRFGSSMSVFPREYKNHIPADSKSKVGRMLSIKLLDGGADRFQPLKEFLAVLSGVEKHGSISENEPFPSTGANGIRRSMSLEELQTQLDRRNEIGMAGELVALKYEQERLRSRDVSCPDPERYVKHVALTDVGQGYDIESSWPGHERCIEVKSSTSSGNDIYMSDNEKRVLTKLGDKAWLYRVVVDANGDGEVVLRINDPMNRIPDHNISVAVWRIQLPKSEV